MNPSDDDALRTDGCVPNTPFLKNQVFFIVNFQGFFIEQLLPVSIYMIPAIFGALGVVFIARHWRLTIVPSIVMLALFMFVVKDDSIRPALVPIASLISIGSARYFFKKGWIK